MNKPLEASLAKVTEIFTHAEARIDALKVGEKVPATTLANDIASLYDQKGPQMYPLLKVYFDTRADGPDADIKIKRGATGGIEKVK